MSDQPRRALACVYIGCFRRFLGTIATSVFSVLEKTLEMINGLLFNGLILRQLRIIFTNLRKIQTCNGIEGDGNISYAGHIDPAMPGLDSGQYINGYCTST